MGNFLKCQVGFKDLLLFSFALFVLVSGRIWSWKRMWSNRIWGEKKKGTQHILQTILSLPLVCWCFFPLSLFGIGISVPDLNMPCLLVPSSGFFGFFFFELVVFCSCPVALAFLRVWGDPNNASESWQSWFFFCCFLDWLHFNRCGSSPDSTSPS